MKVAIVGAGICGLYLGWKLSEKGQDVTIFEKRDRVGKETCSGLFSERIFDFVVECKKLVQNRINFCLIHLPERSEGWERMNVLRLPKRTLKIRFSKPFFVLSHYQLDNLVASLAKKAGAKIILNHNISESDTDIFQVNFDRVIGCDGANSFVRKSLDLSDPNLWLAIQGFIPEKESKNYVETWPTQKGFLWKIPRGREIEYGIIEKSEQAKKLFDDFLNKNNLHLERINSAIVPQGLIIPKNPKITLCGDAAGLTKPWSGGGVIWGLIAANLLLKNFPDFIKYQKAVKRFFLPKIILSKTAKKLVYFLGFNLPWLLPRKFKIESDFLA